MVRTLASTRGAALCPVVTQPPERPAVTVRKVSRPSQGRFASRGEILLRAGGIDVRSRCVAQATGRTRGRQALRETAAPTLRPRVTNRLAGPGAPQPTTRSARATAHS